MFTAASMSLIQKKTKSEQQRRHRIESIVKSASCGNDSTKMGKKSRRVRGGQQTNQRRKQSEQEAHALTPLRRHIHDETGWDCELDTLASLLADDPGNDSDPRFKAYIRSEMDRMMKIFASRPSNDPWNEDRVNAFYCYGRMLLQSIRTVRTAEDFKFVKQISKSETEPAFLRVFAFRLAGLFSCLGYTGVDPRGEALQHFDNAIATCDSASNEEKGRTIFLCDLKFTVAALLVEQRQTVSEVIKNIAGHIYLSCSPTGVSVRVPILAGSQCDCCGKDRPENTTLMVCGKCKMAHYCSPQCQQKAWKELGHNIECRKKGEFRVGDVALSLDPFGDVSIGALVIITAPGPGDPNPGNPSQWVVVPKPLSAPKVIKLISTRRLRRVRPGQWRLRGMIEATNARSSSEDDIDNLPSLILREEIDEDDAIES